MDYPLTNLYASEFVFFILLKVRIVESATCLAAGILFHCGGAGVVFVVLVMDQFCSKSHR